LRERKAAGCWLLAASCDDTPGDIFCYLSIAWKKPQAASSEVTTECYLYKTRGAAAPLRRGVKPPLREKNLAFQSFIVILR